MKRLLILAIAALITTCGGPGPGPGPSPNKPTINGTVDIVFIGQTVTFTAAGTNVTWGGDTPSVATVDPTTGAVTGLTVGRVTIWAENSGGRTTRLLRVLPSYNGSWSGSYTVTGCQASGDFRSIEFCGSSNFHTGQILNMGFEITQTRDTVSGTFSLGSVQGTLNAGVVNEDGALPLSGTITSEGVTVQLQNLRATSPSPGTIKGTFDQVWGHSALTGTGRLACRIRDVTRTSGAPSMFGRSVHEDMSLEQLIRGVLRRF